MNKPYKAVAAAALTFLGTLLASVQGRKEFDELTVLEWLIVVGSAIVTTGAVYVVDNHKPISRRNQVGESLLYIALVVLAVLLVVFLLARLI